MKLIKYLLFKTQVYAIYIWYRTPWHYAIVRTAIAAYCDSISYRIRQTEMGSEFAAEAFIDYGELTHWKWAAKKDGKVQWWRVILLPFSVHPDAFKTLAARNT